MAKYRAWGNRKEQTIRQLKGSKSIFVLRQSREEISIKKTEIDGLIIALLEVRK